MRAKKREVLFAIDSTEQFLERISPENKKLTCIDLHLPFFGRCETMQENYRSLHVRFDEDFVKMEFLSSTADLVPEEVLASL